MPRSPSSYNHQNVKIDGLNFHYVDEGDPNGELIVLVHGWPELWYVFHHQINYLTNLGYRVVAGDLVGIGGSEGPKVTDIQNQEAANLDKYTFKNNGQVLKQLVQSVLKRDKAIFIGHDWGSPIVFRMAQYFPDVVKAVGSLCIHYVPPIKQFIELDKLIEIIPTLEYQKFIGYDKFESECQQHKSVFFNIMYQYKDVISTKYKMEFKGFLEGYEKIKKEKEYAPIFNDEEFKYFMDQYSPTVISNSCNYYRTHYLNWKDDQALLENPEISCPVLMVHATDDVSNTFNFGKGPLTPDFCTNLTLKEVDGDHWIHLNKKDQVNQFIGDWLVQLKTGNAKF